MDEEKNKQKATESFAQVITETKRPVKDFDITSREGSHKYLRSLSQEQTEVTFSTSVLPSWSVTFRRHPNGGGWVNSKAKVDPKVVVEEKSIVDDESVIFSEIKIRGYSTVSGKSEINGRGIIVDSDIINSKLNADNNIKDSRISNSTIGRSGALRYVFIYDSEISFCGLPDGCRLQRADISGLEITAIAKSDQGAGTVCGRGNAYESKR